MNADDSARTSVHERFMRRCIELAHIAKSRGNTPVGSVVVIGGTTVGEGIEEVPAGANLTGHAEILACQAAVDRTGNRWLEGATLYTTAEPCFMCSYVIRQCGIGLVVYGVDTPYVGGVSSRMPILTAQSLPDWRTPPGIVEGVLLDDCQNLKITTGK